MVASLTGSIAEFRELKGPDMLRRTEAYRAWVTGRAEKQLWPYFRATRTRPGPVCEIMGRGDVHQPETVNFASQDYLSLSNHHDVRAAARAAINEYGVHSAGSAALMGRTDATLRLENALSEFLGYDHVLLFPTGWAAGFGVIRALVRPSDHVVLDGLSHACLQEGASCATPNVHVFGHLKTESLRRLLRKIRTGDTENGILVVSESLFSMNSDTPDIGEIQRLCREYRATLMVDCAHDLGCLGPEGGGHLAAQGLVGKIDIVMGSFSKTFASNGGFIATNSESTYEYLKVFAGPHIFSNALSPVQCAVVHEALEIVRSPEGQRRRQTLLDRILLLRSLLTAADLKCLGEPSPIVPVVVGEEALARLTARHLAQLGLAANLVEYPAVARGAARFRLQVMADHTVDHCRFAQSVFSEAMVGAKRAFAVEAVSARRTGCSAGEIEAEAAAKSLEPLGREPLALPPAE
jgi:7-keto-8-aminopelargonate synthetase-like enzyme